MNESKEIQKPSILFASIISALGIYFPIPILRGAIFGLFPGIAHRSWRMCIKGAILGVMLSLIYTILWIVIISSLLNITWEPRDGFNKFLVFWLPGRMSVVTHSGSSWPNWLQFTVGIMLWFNIMVFGWWIIWKPKIASSCLPVIALITNMSVSISCMILLVVSPMDHWWEHGAAPFADLHSITWAVVFFSVFPVCSLLISIQFKNLKQKKLVLKK